MGSQSVIPEAYNFVILVPPIFLGRLTPLAGDLRTHTPKPSHAQRPQMRQGSVSDSCAPETKRLQIWQPLHLGEPRKKYLVPKTHIPRALHTPMDIPVCLNLVDIHVFHASAVIVTALYSSPTPILYFERRGLTFSMCLLFAV